MPLYAGIDGKPRKLVKFFAGINGEKRELKELWVSENGVKKKIFSKMPTSKLIGFWNTLEHVGVDTQVKLDQSKIYDVWVIEPGGNGGNGGAKWGLYNGGQGGGGYGGAVAHLKFKTLQPNTLVIKIFQGTEGSALTIQDTASGITIKTYSITAQGQSTNGEDAGAFNPNPSNGQTGIGGEASCLANEYFCTPITKETFNGVPSSRITTVTGQVPHETPFTKPTYVANVGQDAYYSLNPDNICLGCGAGGGGVNSGQGGKGAPGGIIVFEEDA